MQITQKCKPGFICTRRSVAIKLTRANMDRMHPSYTSTACRCKSRMHSSNLTIICLYVCVYIWHTYINIYGQASGVPSPPPPSPNGMVWYGVGGGGGLARAERVRAVGAAAGETARRHRPGQHSTQALRMP